MDKDTWPPNFEPSIWEVIKVETALDVWYEVQCGMIVDCGWMSDMPRRYRSEKAALRRRDKLRRQDYKPPRKETIIDG